MCEQVSEQGNRCRYISLGSEWRCEEVEVRHHYRRFRFTCVVLRVKQAASAGRGGVKGE